MIKYIGSKRLLAPLIADLAVQLEARSACDLFAGTTRVGQALRARGIEVHSNDTATYSEQLGLAYIAADRSLAEGLAPLLEELNALPGEPGYFTQTFCRDARFFQPHNGARVDAIRDRIDELTLGRIERGIVLTSLLEAADRVDSTCGVQMAYVKSWARRSYNDLELRVPEIPEGPAGAVTRMDAAELLTNARQPDLIYIDPPYNQHSYFSNYHAWETLVRWDDPEPYGVARKRVDCRVTKSPFNSRREAWTAFETLIAAAGARHLIVSFSNEGFHDPDAIEALLGTRGEVLRIDVDSQRYVGAKIGIHNPAGERVGKVSHLRNKEILFLVGPGVGRLATPASREAASAVARSAA